MNKFFKIIVIFYLLVGAVFANDIEELFKNKLSVPMYFSRVPRGLIISIEDKFFFDPGSEKINRNGILLLDELALVINKIDNDIVVESHCNEWYSSKHLYTELWELSLAKANNITKYLMRCNGVNPERIFSIGYGEISPSKNARDLNNRIDFVILDYQTYR